MKNEDLNAQIGSRLKFAREQAGMSQAQLAKELGYESATAVSLIESGERKVKAEDVQKAAEILHCDAAFLLGQETQAPDIKVALRADKELSDQDKDALMHFIDLAKNKVIKREINPTNGGVRVRETNGKVHRGRDARTGKLLKESKIQQIHGSL